MSKLKGFLRRLAVTVAGFAGWAWFLSTTELPGWFSIPVGWAVGWFLSRYLLKPLFYSVSDDLPENFQLKIKAEGDGSPPRYRWAVLADPYKPQADPMVIGWEWWISDELAHGWSLSRRTARWSGNRSIRRLKKVRDANGRDRQAEANPRDPNPSGTAAAVGAAAAASAGGDADEGAREDGLEVVQGDIPILAHRAAKLRFHGDGRPWAPVTDHGGPFGIDTKAACNRYGLYSLSMSRLYESHGHGSTPSVDCTCGFYALPPDLDATYGHNGRVTLLVELSGRVIEHEKGYRAAHQRVIECRLPACRYCGQMADMVDVLDGEMAQAVCAKHVPSQATPEDPVGLGRVWLSIEDVARALPVPVTREGNDGADR